MLSLSWSTNSFFEKVEFLVDIYYTIVADTAFVDNPLRLEDATVYFNFTRILPQESEYLVRDILPTSTT